MASISLSLTKEGAARMTPSNDVTVGTTAGTGNISLHWDTGVGVKKRELILALKAFEGYLVSEDNFPDMSHSPPL